jgi:hypothetical protein
VNGPCQGRYTSKRGRQSRATADGTDLQGVGGPAVNTMMSGPATVPSYSQVRDRKLEPARPTGGALLGGIGRVIRSRTARYNQLIARDAEGFVPGSREAGD